MLTDIQREVLSHLRECQGAGEPMPTLRDLCATFGWRSTGTARDHLRALVSKGVLLPAGGRARSYRLAESVDFGPVVHIPLLGRVVAGEPVEAYEYHEGNVAVAAERVANRECFALRVWGDSMKDAGIMEDDIVIVEKRSHADNNDIVVALVDGEATIKRFNRKGRKHLRLLPENEEYEPIELKSRDFYLVGVVIGVQRWYR